MKELVTKTMCILIAPDGSPQLSTLAPDFAQCVSFITLLSTHGTSEPVDVLLDRGFEIVEVEVTMKQVSNGTEETFQNFKKRGK